MSGIVVPVPCGPLAPLERPPSFSIMIRAFQVAATIGESVRSALAQTHPAHEIIVVDDGSTDDLAAALDPFVDQIRMVRKGNGGAGSALNAGARVASGTFVAILDADDAYHPRRIEVLGALATARPDLDVMTTDARFVVRGRSVGSFVAHNPFPVVDQRRAILTGNCVGGWPAVRRTRFLEIGGFDERLRTGFGLGVLDPPHPRRCAGRAGRRGLLRLPPAAGEPDGQPGTEPVVAGASPREDREPPLPEPGGPQDPGPIRSPTPLARRSRGDPVHREGRRRPSPAAPTGDLWRPAAAGPLGRRPRAVVPSVGRRLVPEDRPPERRFGEPETG